MDWQFAQSFGTEESEDHGFCEDDIFTALDFDNSGRYIALGDKAGRITVFESVEVEEDKNDKDKKKKGAFHPIEYKFHSEFQSHERGFDRLHSVEISESINMIRWWKHQTGGLSLLSTNDTTVKLWKIWPKRVRRGRRNSTVSDSTNNEADEYPPLSPGQIPPPNAHPKTVMVATCKREFKNAHGTCHIDSISQNSDGATFISTDALKIMLWDIEKADEAFNIVNIKPDNLADLSEVITTATFHPSHCSLMSYSTSLGATRLVDLRESALIGSSVSKVFQTKKGDGFFSEVVESISDARFTPDGRYIVTRDYLTTKLWDVNMDKKPVLVLPVHDYLEEYLNELHQNDCIFDKFEIATSPSGLMYVTGSYDSNFVIHSANKYNETIHATSEPVKKKSQKMFSFGRKSKDKKARVAKMDFAKKSLHVAWHPKLNAVAVASLNKVYIYQSP